MRNSRPHFGDPRRTDAEAGINGGSRTLAWENARIWDVIFPKVGRRQRLTAVLPSDGRNSINLCSRRQGGSPWENVVNLVQTSYTGPLDRGLSLVAIVIGGLMFAFGEGQSKSVFASIIFGVGIALGAANLMSWLFGVA